MCARACVCVCGQFRAKPPPPSEASKAKAQAARFDALRAQLRNARADAASRKRVAEELTNSLEKQVGVVWCGTQSTGGAT